MVSMTVTLYSDWLNTGGFSLTLCTYIVTVVASAKGKDPPSRAWTVKLYTDWFSNMIIRSR